MKRRGCEEERCHAQNGTRAAPGCLERDRRGGSVKLLHRIRQRGAGSDLGAWQAWHPGDELPLDSRDAVELCDLTHATEAARRFTWVCMRDAHITIDGAQSDGKLQLHRIRMKPGEPVCPLA